MVEDQTGLGNTAAVRASLLSGGIDLYWEYTGTGAVIHLAQGDVPDDPQAVYENVSEMDLEQNDIVWLKPAPANNSYAIAVRDDASDADVAGVETISDLARLVEKQPDKATICVGPEFERRADGLRAVESQYGFEFPDENVLVFPVTTVYRAIDSGEQCNFGTVFRTSGYISELGLRMLEDDQGAFPPYNPAVTVRAEVLERYPDLEPLIADIASRLDEFFTVTRVDYAYRMDYVDGAVLVSAAGALAACLVLLVGGFLRMMLARPRDPGLPIRHALLPDLAVLGAAGVVGRVVAWFPSPL